MIPSLSREQALAVIYDYGSHCASGAQVGVLKPGAVSPVQQRPTARVGGFNEARVVPAAVWAHVAALLRGVAR